MVEGFPTLAWEEAGLTTQTVKNRIYVQPSAQANWSRFLDLSPRNAQSELPVHAIPDGSERVDSFDHGSERKWPDENGVNILGDVHKMDTAMDLVVASGLPKSCLSSSSKSSDFVLKGAERVKFGKDKTVLQNMVYPAPFCTKGIHVVTR